MQDCFNETEKHYGDTACRPDMQGVIINGKRGRILTRIFKAGGEGLHPTVLMLHGIPGTEQNFDLAQYLKRKGFNVVTFHYSGSWGSDGDYSLSHNLEDSETVLDYIINNTDDSFDQENIFVIGHSLGGFACGQILARRNELKAGVLLMPCDIGRLADIEHSDAESYSMMIDVLEESAGWLNGTSKDKLCKEAYDNSSEFSLASHAAALAKKPILCCTGSLDDVTPDEQFCKPLREAIKRCGGTQLEHHSYPTDHFFSDYRLTISEVVYNFLNNQLHITR